MTPMEDEISHTLTSQATATGSLVEPKWATKESCKGVNPKV